MSSCARSLPVSRTDLTRSVEWELCKRDPVYFARTCCQIYDAEALGWIPFELWDEQVEVLELVHDEQLVIVLKARQLGLTWLMLAYALWLMLFRPIATVLIFSLRDNEAIYLLGEERLRGMFERLPDWMQPAVEVDAAHEWKLANGSTARAFPTSAGDSYTATFALVDEADLVPDLGKLLGRVKPTIDAGGKLVLISRVDKSRPQTRFKQIYRQARAGLSQWHAVFLSWRVRPSRTQAWYEEQKRDTLEQTGALDDLYEQYPETDAQALSGKTLDKRLHPKWLEDCYQPQAPLQDVPAEVPAINGLALYRLPEPGRTYVIGVDPAEGNPTSDDSALSVLDMISGEEVAHLSGKFQPEVIAAHADALGLFYNRAGILPERNNHGHAVLLWLKDNGRCSVLYGLDRKPGWLSTSVGKALLYDALAESVREQNTRIHSFKTFTQLGSIEGSTLRAPEGEMDDAADSFALANKARALPRHRAGVW